MAVTKDQIFSTATEQAAAGQRPTMASIRKVLGGSYSTIGPALNEWKAKQAAAAPLREPVPEAVADACTNLGESLWAVARDLASDRLATERKALEEARAALEDECTEARKLADQHVSDADALRSRLASSEASEAVARGEADQLRVDLSAATSRALVAETRVQEVELRANTLTTELQRVHENADAMRKLMSELQQAADVQINELRSELAKANAHAEAARQFQQKARDGEAERIGIVRALLGKAENEAARLAGELAALKEQNSALIARITPASKGK
jgi:chromosome segregation ATPase